MTRALGPTPVDNRLRTVTRVAIGVCLLIVFLLIGPFTIVSSGHRGVMTTWGKPSPEVFDEGLHFKWPLAQTMHLVDVSIQKGEGEGDAASKDMQMVKVRVALNYHVLPSAAVSIYRDLGNEPGIRIIDPGVHEAVKASTAGFTAEELITKREEVRNRIIETLRDRFSRHGLVIDEFSIVNLAFSEKFNEAIEAKTTAEQLKIKADRDLERIKVEAQQKVAAAQAEADSLGLQRQHVTAELLRLRETENQAKAIEKWDGHLPATLTGGGIPFINLTSK